MKIGSLFSGIGGLELGLCAAIPNAEIVWQAERDPYALAVLAHHWPSVKRYTDVRDIDATTEHVDIICGGFPCQPHSTAGKRKGIGDERWIWPEFARIIDVIKPNFVFIENVSGLRTSGLRNVLSDLAQIGFNAEWDIFGACCVGAPHRRERLFILASNANSYCDRLETHSDQRVVCESADNKRSAGYIGAVGGEEEWSTARPIGARPMGVGDGIRSDLDRIKCLGNAVVPKQAALAWRELMKRIA